MHTAPTATSHHCRVSDTSVSPASAATEKHRNAALRTAVGRGQPRPDQPHRADPLVVGAADAVGVVVGVVDADHQRDGDDQREQRPHRLHRPRADRRAGADEHRGDRGRQRPRPRPRDPLADARHGLRLCESDRPGRCSGPLLAGHGRGRQELAGPDRAASCPPRTAAARAAPSAASPTIRAAASGALRRSTRPSTRTIASGLSPVQR